MALEWETNAATPRYDTRNGLGGKALSLETGGASFKLQYDHAVRPDKRMRPFLWIPR